MCVWLMGWMDKKIIWQSLYFGALALFEVIAPNMILLDTHNIVYIYLILKLKYKSHLKVKDSRSITFESTLGKRNFHKWFSPINFFFHVSKLISNWTEFMYVTVNLVNLLIIPFDLIYYIMIFNFQPNLHWWILLIPFLIWVSILENIYTKSLV